jgi:YfiH family protein
MSPDRGRRVRWMEQVHGSRVLVAGVTGSERHPVRRADPVACAGPADALAATGPELALAVLTADCASIALGSPEGVFAAVHAGWRGLVAGVVDRAARAMRAMGATELVGALGPCIHAECYEFSEVDLRGVAAVCGDAVRGRTSAGRPALDLPAAVASVLAGSGVRQVPGPAACTSCAAGYFSHRARGDRGRQALVVWSREAPAR